MAEVLYSVENLPIEDLPRHLRNGAALGGMRLELAPKAALHIVRALERDSANPAVIVVDRTPPFASLAVFFFALMLSAQICAMMTPAAIWLARILAGWIHG